MCEIEHPTLWRKSMVTWRRSCRDGTVYRTYMYVRSLLEKGKEGRRTRSSGPLRMRAAAVGQRGLVAATAVPVCTVLNRLSGSRTSRRMVMMSGHGMEVSQGNALPYRVFVGSQTQRKNPKQLYSPGTESKYQIRYAIPKHLPQPPRDRVWMGSRGHIGVGRRAMDEERARTHVRAPWRLCSSGCGSGVSRTDCYRGFAGCGSW